MKILLISAIPLFPAGEGHRSRILNLCRAIRSLGHDLHYVFLPTSFPGAFDREAHLKEFGAGRFTELKREGFFWKALRYTRLYPFQTRRRVLRKLKIDSGYYNHLDEFYFPGFRPQLQALHEAEGFEAVVVEYIFHSAALDAFPGSVLKVLDTHDSFADRHKPYVARGLPTEYWFSVPPDDENRAFRRSDVVIAIQEEESRTFRTQLDKNGKNPEVAVVSHFIDLSDPVRRYDGKDGLFLGSANPSNIISVRAFVDNVLPLIVSRLPDFRFVLVGSICREIADHPDIVKLGRVDLLRDAFERAPISINATLVGTGINIKLLDAMAAGVATVSTHTGVRGLPDAFHDGLKIVGDQDAKGFADAVIALAGDETLRRTEGLKAYEAAKRWNAAQVEALQDVLARLPGKPAQKREVRA